ncbi:hypothetical protein HY411_01120 [Candidatus Gottesmanbacteria bacterium]|nr:hypothetical protein [Candidatus Gottesmanbacteria bacterium]
MKSKMFRTILPSLVAVVLLVGAGLLPTIVPYLATPKDRVYTGIHGHSDDYVGYVSYIKEGIDGNTTMTFRSYPFAQPQTPVHIFYIVLGHLARLAGLSAVFAYHAARVVLAVVFVLTSYRLFFLLWQSAADAFLGTVMAFTSSSLGSLNYFDFSLVSAERVTDRPHYLFGAILFLWVVTVFIQNKKMGLPGFVTLFLVGLSLAVVHPSFAVMLAIITLVLFFREPSFRALAVGIGLGAGLLLMYWTLSRYGSVGTIWFNVYTYSTSVTARTLLGDFLSFGPTLWIGLPTLMWITVTRRPHDRSRFVLLVWISIQLLLFYFLYPLFRADRVRFIQSLYFLPLAYGSMEWVRMVCTRWGKRAVTLGALVFIGLALPTYITDLKRSIYTLTDYRTYSVFVFPTIKQREAYAFLEKNTPKESVVLAWFESSNHILLYSHNVVVGNTQAWPKDAGAIMTGDRDQLFSGKLSEPDAQKLLANYHIRYIYYGYQERFLGSMAHYPFLRPVFANEEATIYEVVGG